MDAWRSLPRGLRALSLAAVVLPLLSWGLIALYLLIGHLLPGSAWFWLCFGTLSFPGFLLGAWNLGRLRSGGGGRGLPPALLLVSLLPAAALLFVILKIWIMLLALLLWVFR